MKVLIADDDPVIRHQVRGIMERLGHDVMECTNGQEVLAKIFTGELPQLVFLDVVMPGVHGFEVCKAIREQANLPYTYVILLTSKSEREDVVTGLRAGANDFIMKPVRMPEFEARLQVALQMVNLNSLVEAQRLQLMSSAKMAFLGQMAGGVAHEINNPLAIIMSYMETWEFLKEAERPAATEAINRSIDRIRKITRALCDFAAEDDGSPFTPMTVASLVEIAAGFCGEKIKRRGIDLQIRLPEDLSVLEGQKMRLAQVLVALLENALSSVLGNSSPWVRIEGAEDSDFIYIAISDNGPLLDSALRQQIMRPFLSTRDIGQDTALGLSVARGIAEFHGGRLTVDGRSPHTRLVLTLPKMRKVAA